MPKRAGYSASDDRRTVKILCVRTTAYENVRFKDVGLSTDLRDKENSSVHARRRASSCFQAGWLIVAHWLLLDMSDLRIELKEIKCQQMIDLFRLNVVHTFTEFSCVRRKFSHADRDDPP